MNEFAADGLELVMRVTTGKPGVLKDGTTQAIAAGLNLRTIQEWTAPLNIANASAIAAVQLALRTAPRS